MWAAGVYFHKYKREGAHGTDFTQHVTVLYTKLLSGDVMCPCDYALKTPLLRNYSIYGSHICSLTRVVNISV